MKPQSTKKQNPKPTTKAKAVQPVETKLAKATKLQKALERINAACGREVTQFGAKPESVELLPTGMESLDRLLKVGSRAGIPSNGLTELYGPKDSGKTFRALRLIAATQERGGTCAFVDLGHSFDHIMADTVGVDLSSLVLAAPMGSREAMSVLEELFKSSELTLVVVDGLGALYPEEGETKTNLLVNVARSLALWTAKYNTACVITRRMNPDRGFEPAGNAALHKLAKTSLECYTTPQGVGISLKKHVNGSVIPESATTTATPYASARSTWRGGASS